MGKRSVGRAITKAKAADKRGAAKDLSARKEHTVVGGLLPAVQARPGAQAGDPIPTESISFSFDRMTYKY